jgi:hypothetical protein
MELSEQELREMIRDAIARALGRDSTVAPAGSDDRGAAPRTHASHALFALIQTGDGECVIEPSVRCNHCGYCKSLGH